MAFINKSAFNYLARVRYIADGLTDTFGMHFGYIQNTHVSVEVAGSKLVAGTDYEFINSNEVRLFTMPAASEVVYIYRTTPIDSQIVEFQDLSNLKSEQLNNSALQSIYAMQEVYDEVADSMTRNSDGDWDAGDARIVNLADGIDPQDAATIAQLNRAYDETLAKLQPILNEIQTRHDDVVAKHGEVSAAKEEIDLIHTEVLAKYDEMVQAVQDVQAQITIATNAANQASGSATAAASSELAAKSYKDLAYKWANNPEDEIVEGSEYSAKHWAQKAKESAGGGGTVNSVNGRNPDGAGEIILDKIQGDETSTGTPSLTVEGTDVEPFTTFYYRTKEGKLARLWYHTDGQEWHHDVSGAGYNIDIDGSSYIKLAKNQPVDFPKGITINGAEIPNLENAGTVKSVNGSESDVNGEVTLTHLLSKTGSLVGGTKFEVAYSSDNGGYSYYRYKTNFTSYDKTTSHHSGAWTEKHRGSSITKSIGNYDYQKVSSIGVVDFPAGMTVKGKALPDANKIGTVKDVNGSTPDASGSVTLDVGVKTINGKAPDADGNVELAGGGGSGGIVLGNMVLNGGFSQMHLSGCHKYQDMEEYPVGGSMFMYPAINPSSTFEISGQSNINVESTNRGFKQIRLDTITNSSSGVIAFELNTEKMFEAIETGIGWITISFIAEGNLSHYLCSGVRGRIGSNTNTFVTFAKSTSYKLIGKTSEGEPIYRYFSTYKVNNILNHKYWNFVRNNPNSLAYLKLQSSTSITSNANIRIHSLSVHHSGEEALWSQINENSSYSVPSGEIASYSDALDSENMALANERYKYAVVDLEVLVNNYKLGKLPIIDNKYIPLLKVPNDTAQREGRFIIYAATSSTNITKKYSKSMSVSHATDANGDRYACLYNVNLDSFIAEIDTGTITTSDLKYAMCSISSQPHNYGITGI